jgi:GNAT superfamily N-acetyltransferase
MGDFTLRRATRDDTDAARALLEELGYAFADEPTFARGFAAVLADSAQAVWLATGKGTVLGLMSMSSRPQVRLAGVIVTIDELVVHELARGQGVGASLLELAREESVRLGARRVELLTARSRESYARGFYVKNGFAEAPSAVMRWTPA